MWALVRNPFCIASLVFLVVATESLDCMRYRLYRSSLPDAERPGRRPFGIHTRLVQQKYRQVYGPDIFFCLYQCRFVAILLFAIAATQTVNAGR